MRPFTTVGIYNETLPANKRFKAERFFIIDTYNNGIVRDVTNHHDLHPSEHWRFHEAVSFAFYSGRTVSITTAYAPEFETQTNVNIRLEAHMI